MSSKRETRVCLKDILTQIDIIESNLPDISREKFMTSPFCQNAMIRSIEVIGEAVKNIPSEFKLEHTNIPWKLIAGTRDKLIHAYDVVDLVQVWNIIIYDIPELKKEVQDLLQE